MDMVTTRATRRAFLSTIAASASLGAVRAARRAGTTPANGDTTMYGLIGKMTATPGQRDALIAILLEGTGAMPGCLSYIVAADPADADAIWITEVWDSEASHKASLALPGVKFVPIDLACVGVVDELDVRRGDWQLTLQPGRTQFT